jgi:hypothetical protein
LPRYGRYREQTGEPVTLRAEAAVLGHAVGDEFSIVPNPQVRHLLAKGDLSLVDGYDPREREVVGEPGVYALPEDQST